MTTVIRALALACLASFPLACSSSPAAPSTGTSSASLRSDVLPIFQASCASNNTCHGSPSGIEVFLTGTSAQASDVRRRLVSVPSSELASMPYVTPGDPANSYLMHKVDGTQSPLGTHCQKGDCGAQMPKGQSPLSPADRAIIRAWIEAGALDD